MAMPLAGDPVATVDAATSPSNIMAKYSAGPKLKEYSTISGENSVIKMMPTLAPKNDATVVMNSATPERPCCDIG